MAENRRKFILGGAAAIGAANAAKPASPQAVAASNPALDSEKFRTAVVTGDIAAVNKYLDGDPALLYARDAHGNSVYTLACLAGQAKTAEALAARGLVLDIFEAAVSGNVKRATELANATPGIARIRSADGRTPLHFAAAGGQPDMVMFINGRGADLSAGPESPLLAAVDYPDLGVALEMTQTLVGNASDPNARRKDGKTCLL
jgi:ankyrin repeat protein